jgi:hypothetical protein
MPYHPNIPQSTDDPALSQSDLLDNFQALLTQWSVNHVPLTAGGSQGLHTQVFFNAPLGTDPGLSLPQASVYTKAVAGIPQLFFQNGSMAANVFQLTGLPIVTVGTNYGFVTPWGVTFNMGKATSSPITFAVSFTGTPYVALVSNVAPSTTQPAVGAFSGSPVSTLTYTPAGASVYYLVLGGS